MNWECGTAIARPANCRIRTHLFGITTFVRVMLDGLLSVRLFDLIGRGILVQSKKFVKLRVVGPLGRSHAEHGGSGSTSRLPPRPPRGFRDRSATQIWCSSHGPSGVPDDRALLRSSLDRVRPRSPALDVLVARLFNGFGRLSAPSVSRAMRAMRANRACRRRASWLEMAVKSSRRRCVVESVARTDPSEISISEGVGSRPRPLAIEISSREEESKVRGARRLGQGGATVGAQGTETDEEWWVERKASCSGHGGNGPNGWDVGIGERTFLRRGAGRTESCDVLANRPKMRVVICRTFDNLRIPSAGTERFVGSPFSIPEERNDPFQHPSSIPDEDRSVSPGQANLRNRRWLHPSEPSSLRHPHQCTWAGNRHRIGCSLPGNAMCNGRVSPWMQNLALVGHKGPEHDREPDNRIAHLLHQVSTGPVQCEPVHPVHGFWNPSLIKGVPVDPLNGMAGLLC